MLAIGSGFVFFSGIAIVGSLQRLALGPKPLNWTETLMPLMVTAVFGPVGLLLMMGFVWATRKLRSEHDLKAKYPNQPWRHRDDWAKNRSEHCLASRAIAYVAIALTFNFNKVLESTY